MHVTNKIYKATTILRFDNLKIVINSIKIIIKKKINKEIKKMPPWYKEKTKTGTNMIADSSLLASSILKSNLKFEKILLFTIISFSIEVIK